MKKKATAHLRTLAAAALAALGLTGCSAHGVVIESPPPEPGQAKVVLCHKGKKTLQVAEPAVDAHLRHGDTLGPCR